MKKLIMALLLVGLSSAAVAEDRADLLRELSTVPVVSPGSPPADLSRQTVRVAALARDSRALLPAMELPASEFFTIAEDEEVSDEEFELKFPEEELPDSDIPLTVNEKVQHFIRYFQGPGRKSFARWLSRSERYIPMMKDILRTEGMPEDLVYLAMIESGFTPHAVSVASAVGPWQFISGTGKRYDLRIDQWIDERRDPVKSTVAAALYLKELYALFNNDWYLAAAGYNAGENKILRAITMYNSRDFWQLSKGGYLKPETKDYVPKLLAAAIIAKDPARYGFADVAYLPPIEYDTVTIPSSTDLELVARLCDVPLPVVQELNPELRRWCTPPNYPDYQLKLPYGRKASFEEAYARIPENERLSTRTVHVSHRMGRKERLASVARKYGTTEETLREVNGLRKGQRLAGKRIKVPVTVKPGTAESAPVTANSRATDDRSFTKYYTVKKGDTLESVARRFSVTTNLLTAWNNLKARVALSPGKRLIVAKYVQKKGSMVSEG
jgi:membrane-bound lytic murein transglycosylase D